MNESPKVKVVVGTVKLPCPVQGFEKILQAFADTYPNLMVSNPAEGCDEYVLFYERKPNSEET